MRVEAVRDVVDPVVASLDLEVFDLTIEGRTLQLSVDREGGVDLDALTAVTHAVSAALDAAEQAGADLGQMIGWKAPSASATATTSPPAACRWSTRWACAAARSTASRNI